MFWTFRANFVCFFLFHIFLHGLANAVHETTKKYIITSNYGQKPRNKVLFHTVIDQNTKHIVILNKVIALFPEWRFQRGQVYLHISGLIYGLVLLFLSNRRKRIGLCFDFQVVYWKRIRKLRLGLVGLFFQNHEHEQLENHFDLKSINTVK